MPIPQLKNRMYEPPLPGRDDDGRPLPIRVVLFIFRMLWGTIRIIFFPLFFLVRVGARRARERRLTFSSLVLGALLAIMIIVGVGGLTSALLLAYLGRSLPDPAHLAFRNVVQSTKIYDRTGTSLLYDIHGTVRRTVIPLSDIPRTAVLATIAVEDKNFYVHRGLAPLSILRATFFNVFGNAIGRLVLRRSEGSGGASTLTQQLAKNAILSNERTLSRKIKEAYLAYRIERRFSKDEILGLYFNEIPYGSVSYGIEAAAETFFNKHAKDLDLAESALLAALPKAPTRLSPYGNHTDELVARTHHVLDLMASQGMISAEEAARAKQADVLARVTPKHESIAAPHFVLYVKELLTEQYGEEAVERGGFTVITTLDRTLQGAAEKAVTDGIPAIEAAGGSNAALVALDPRSGEILAMVGSRDYFDDEHDGQVNVVLRPRQPGSSIKPVVYAAAFAKGYTPTTLLLDANTDFKTDQGLYSPKNYDLQEHGVVSARQALAGSLNIPAVKMLYLTGVSRVLDLAEALGYSTLGDRSRFGLALVLGGAEVKLLEHASAIGSLAADGVHHAPVAILKVQDSHGIIIDEWKPSDGVKALEPEVAREVTSIMQDNAARAFVFGATNHLTLPDQQVAAKTGTTNDFRDAWAVGFVPSLVAGVWTGNNNNHAMKRGADGSKIAAPIWNAFMRAALASTAPEGFMPPSPVVTGKPILDGQSGGEVTVRVDQISGKLATEKTPPELVLTRTYRVGGLHSELYYINKDDPRGPPPSNPGDDPQFALWEEAANRYAIAHGLAGSGGESPPTEYDDVHTTENTPTIRVLSPTEGTALTSRDLVVGVETLSPRFPLERVEVRIDGVLVGSSISPPFSVAFSIPATITRGFHSLEVRAIDSVKNAGTATVNINLAAD